MLKLTNLPDALKNLSKKEPSPKLEFVSILENFSDIPPQQITEKIGSFERLKLPLKFQ